METVMETVIEEKLSFAGLRVVIRQIGSDWLICLEGGEKPHIGCAVLAVPRPSLRGDGSTGSTASVLNLTGHKDEELCRYLAEQTARKKQGTVVCTGGFHVEHITDEQLHEVIEAVKRIADQI